MKSNRVHVWLRVRPSQNFPENMIDIQNDGKSVVLHMPKDTKRGVVNNQVLNWSFKMDGIFHNSNQEHIYGTLGSDIILSGLAGYNGTILCYGQTGAGKTYTVTGATENFNNRGIVPRALSHLFRQIEQQPDLAVTVRISYLEIYNEQIFDLLSTMPDCMESSTPLVVAEDDKSVYVKGLTCHLAQTEEEALNLLFEGETNRATAAHTLNKRSSRSHCIFTVYLETRSRVHSDSKYTVAKLNFVDLAGSERIQKTQSTGKILTEASYINKSLSFLEQTVMALADRGRDHVPFRQSKLTHYLKDSIGGNCRTTLICNIWGEAAQIEETISTLRFGSRMMRVASEPVENKQYDASVLVHNLKLEIESLKRELAMHDTLSNRTQVSYDPLSEQQKYEIRQQVRKYVNGELDEIDIVNIRQIQGVFESFRDLSRNATKEAEESIRARYPDGKLPKPGEPAGAGPAGVAEVADDGESVGDLYGRGFGVGAASRGILDESGAYLQGKRKERKKGTPSPTKPTRGEQGSIVKETAEMSRGPSEPDMGGEGKEEPRAEPPTRTEAFEEFKTTVGSEIHKILSENKDVLTAKKKEYSSLANQINSTKIEIDRSRLNLDALKLERETQGPTYTPQGEMIITEEEYLEITRLRELKNTYKKDYEELKNLKSQLHYCQKMVDLTRQRLIEEFDRWYAESFLEPGQMQTSAEAGFGARLGTNQTQAAASPPYEDPLERFDRVKHERYMPIVDAEPFNRAKEAMIHRHVYQAAKQQAQPVRRKPGDPVVSAKDHPPTTLQIHA